MKNDFKDAKLGDKVWDIMHGWGKIIEIYKDPKAPYPIKVSDFEDGSLYTETYTRDGKTFRNHINPTLFWDEINIKSPPRPQPKQKGSIYIHGHIIVRATLEYEVGENG